MRLERLEDRNLPAGMVTVGVDSQTGVLTITGDNQANEIVIHQVASPVPPGMFIPTMLGYRIRGIDTKVREINDDSGFGVAAQRSPARSAVTIWWGTEIHINLAGGQDSLRIYNTSLAGPLTIDMGWGSDTLRMKNVHVLSTQASKSAASAPLNVNLGDGADRTILDNVTSATDLNIDAGAGRDRCTVRQVAAGTTGSGGALAVEMGSGKHDFLRIVQAIADNALLSDTSGAGGILLHSADNFGSESDTGFQTVR